MDDLISREKLKRKFCGHCEDYGKCEEECFDLRIINSMPTADLSEYSDKLWKTAYERGKAEARSKGKWSVEDCHAATYKYCCSECKAHHRARYDYCPTCGARMEESE